MADTQRKTHKQSYTGYLSIQRVKAGWLRLSFSVKLARQFWNKERYFFYPGLADTPENYSLLETKCHIMYLDILSGTFDPSFEKYGLGTKKTCLTVVTPIRKSSFLELYDQYCDYRTGTVEQTTLDIEFKGTFHRAISEAIAASGEDAIGIRNHLVKNRGSKLVKECLRHLSKACQLAVKHKKLADNPFDGMAEQITIPKGKKKTQANFDDEDGDDDVRAFTVDEMNAIIASFESSGHRRHFTPIIKFLFYSGCRTGEAVGLKWRDIKWERELITIRRTFNPKIKIFKPTKTNTIRFLPMPKEGLLWNLLKSLPEKSADDVVFTSKTGRITDAGKLHEIWRGKNNKYDRHPGVIPTLINQGKVKEYLRLYATRHTFISHQVNICKVPITTVAQWVGNSALVSNNAYLNRDCLNIPGNPNLVNQVPINNLPSQLVDVLASLNSSQIEQLKALLSSNLD